MSRLPFQSFFLFAVFSVFAITGFTGNKVSGVTHLPGPAPLATPPPWYSEDTIDAATKDLEGKKDLLGTEKTSVVESAKSNIEKQTQLAQEAAPKNQELETAVAAIKATEGEISNHAGRCHDIKLEPGPYNACLGEHNELNAKYDGQVNTAKRILGEINALKGQWDAYQKQNEEYQRRWETLKTQEAQIEKQIAKLAELKQKIPSCNNVWSRCAGGRCSKGFEEALKHCYAVFWDGADAGLPALPDNPNLPFFAEPNSDSGDAGVVDSRGVKKMTDAERQAELAKPGVQRPKDRRPHRPPPRPDQ